MSWRLLSALAFRSSGSGRAVVEQLLLSYLRRRPPLVALVVGEREQQVALEAHQVAAAVRLLLLALHRQHLVLAAAPHHALRSLGVAAAGVAGDLHQLLKHRRPGRASGRGLSAVGRAG